MSTIFFPDMRRIVEVFTVICYNDIQFKSIAAEEIDMNSFENWKENFNDESPLDRIPENGGFLRVFKRLGIIGDSLSSGEYETVDDEGTHHYSDRYDYSWGWILGQKAGIEVLNFSRGGMTAKEYMTRWAGDNGFFSRKLACQGYILALGVNDLINNRNTCGTIMDAENQNTEVFAGQFYSIIEKYRQISPKAKFFLVTMPRGWEIKTPETDMIIGQHAELMRKIAERNDDCYVIDLNRYAPIYDEEFREKFFSYGHMNPMGYIFTGDMIAAYMDFIIRHNYRDFVQVGLEI